MTHTYLSGRPRRRMPSLVTAVTVAAVAALIGPATTAAHADTTPTTLQQAEDTAAAQAVTTGKPVDVTAATDATSTLTAEPDGTFTRVISSQPQRVQRDGAWVPLDATLSRNADGTYSPSASTTGLTLSGGGSAPLATLDNDGKQLSLSWPAPLPAPTISDSSALYANVLPDVDLKVTADEQGGFAEVLIVKTASAASNPALATLKLSADTGGLALATDSAGNLTATDPSTGDAVFHAPAPLMWDSATGTSVQPSSSGTSASDASFTQSTMDASDEAASTDLSDGPGPQSEQAPVAVSVSDNGQQLNLTPDQALLTGNDPADFPVYIDPTWISVTKDSTAFTYVQSAYPGTSNYNDTGGSDPGVGDQGWSSPTGAERTYYQFSIGTTMGDHTINSALLNVTQTYSADWSCTSYTVTELNVDHISSSTTWDNQPGTFSQTATHGFTGSNNDGCAGTTKGAFDVTDSVANDGDGIVTYRLTGSETNRDAYKRFSKNATLTIQYNTPPSTPTSTTSSPAPTNPSTYGCNSGPYGWIGKNNGVTLSAHISDPDGDKQNIRGQFAFWDKGGDGTSTASNLISTGDADGDSSWISGSGGTVHITVDPTDHPLKNGHLYGWHVRADDGIDQSAETTNCYLWYDGSSPTGVTVTTNDYPSDGSGTKHAGDTATFQLAATDPVPSGANASGIDHFDWSPVSSADLDGDGGTPQPATTSGTATISYAPSAWGSNTLWVAAVDKAGNESAPVSLTFYVPADLTGQVHPGDIDNDGRPDLLAADSATGNLDLISPTHEIPAGGPTLASDAADAPVAADGTTTWAGTLTAHRSGRTQSATGNWVDDLWPYKNEHLWLYSNNLNNTGGLAGNNNLYYTRSHRVSVTHPSCGTCGTAYPTSWSAVTQLVAPGDVDGDGCPDLVTVENGSLWLYHGASSGQLQNPVQLGTATTWDNDTVMAPGDATGDSTPDLWARDKTTGNLYLYPLTASGTGVTLDSPILFGSGSFTATSRPLITSIGDFDGDGYPDLLSVINTKQLWANMGQAPDSNGNRIGAHNTVSTDPLWQTVTGIS